MQSVLSVPTSVRPGSIARSSIFGNVSRKIRKTTKTRTIRRRTRTGTAVVIKRDPLVCDRNDNLEWALWSLLRLIFLGRFRFRVPVLVIVPQRSVIAPPRPVLGPKNEFGVRGPYRKYARGKCSQKCCANS